MKNCEHMIVFRYRLTEDKPIPHLEVRAQCKKCEKYSEWYMVKADKVDHDIKKKRAVDNFLFWDRKVSEYDE